MRGIASTLFGLPGAKVVLAGAAILAGAAVPASAAADGEEVALAQPRVATTQAGGTGPSLPQPLSTVDAARIRRIFALQADGNPALAASKMERLGDALLHGHILADRLLRPDAHPEPGAVLDWLRRYGELPDAAAIRRLLPKDALAEDAPAAATQSGNQAVPGERGPKQATGAEQAAAPRGTDDLDPVERIISRNALLDRTVRERARAGRPDLALRLLATTKGLSTLYGAQLRAEIAQLLFTQGRDREAVALAQAAHRQANGELGLPPYIAGLAAWRMGWLDLAAPLFEDAAHAPLATTALRAGASFWVARVHVRRRDMAGARPWFRRAAQQGRTFYGLLARRALGGMTGGMAGGLAARAAEPAQAQAVLGEADVNAVAETPAGQRAFGLIQVGQPRRAEAELAALWSSVQDRPGLARSVLLVAREAGFGALAQQALPNAPAADEGVADLPMPALRPTGGFRIDPALVYALARLESNFDSTAVSPAGARGLMQIMPNTALFMVKDGRDGKGPEGLPRLHDPATNLDLGQRYIMHLASLDVVGGDLIRLLASYNAGPGSFGRWAGTIRHDGDPLLFIESIPNDETRAYVPRALAWTWLYAGQLRRPAPSLDELLAGNWPRLQAGAASGAAAPPVRAAENAVLPHITRLH